MVLLWDQGDIMCRPHVLLTQTHVQATRQGLTLPKEGLGSGQGRLYQESLDSAHGAPQEWLLPGGNSEQMAGRAKLTIP